MKVFFDTSVLVSAAVDQLSRHEPALECFIRFTSKRHESVCSTHALAETYATLTALPIPRRITPDEARKLIENTFLPRLTVLPLSGSDYERAIHRCADLGVSSGIIYDALHLGCAEQSDCRRVYTYNTSHFNRLGPQGPAITAP